MYKCEHCGKSSYYNGGRPICVYCGKLAPKEPTEEEIQAALDFGKTAEQHLKG